MKRNENILPPAYEGVERHLSALFYSGVYITNADIVEVAKDIGLELPMKDRNALLKHVMRYAHENGKKSELMQSFAKLLANRVERYKDLSKNFSDSNPLIKEW
ncbi:MAG: hypothetical protein L3J42_03485, partial [Hydrogenimonas sp.]|nr:hypothetical protein [Hydrogenimonas sp.]